jgi:hypothetical protein
MILYLLELSYCPHCYTFVLIEPICHHAEEMRYCVSPCAELVILCNKLAQGWCNCNGSGCNLGRGGCTSACGSSAEWDPIGATGSSLPHSSHCQHFMCNLDW